MARYEHLPIYKKAMDLTIYCEQIVRNFSRYHKYTLGSELRQKSREVVKLIIKANSTVERLPLLPSRSPPQRLQRCKSFCISLFSGAHRVFKQRFESAPLARAAPAAAAARHQPPGLAVPCGAGLLPAGLAGRWRTGVAWAGCWETPAGGRQGRGAGRGGAGGGKGRLNFLYSFNAAAMDDLSHRPFPLPRSFSRCPQSGRRELQGINYRDLTTGAGRMS